MGNSEENVIDFHRIHVCDMVELPDLPCRIVEVDMQDFPTTIVDELELWELIEIPPIRLTEGQVLEAFMLEEEIEFQEMDKCIVELSNEQEIERCTSQEMSVKMACEQEEFMKEEICNRSLPELPELYKAQDSIHKDDIQLETPKVNTMEISALPREIKLEKSIEQSKSKLHSKQKKVLGSKVVRRANPTKLVKGEICRPPPKPLDSLNDRLKASKRRVNPIRLARRNIMHRPPSTPPFILNAFREGMRDLTRENRVNYRPPPKPPDRQYFLNHKHETKKGRVKPNRNKKARQEIQNANEKGIDALKDKCLMDKEPNCRPPPKPSYIVNTNGEVIGIIENMVPNTRPPLQPPRIHSNVDIKVLEKECLLDTVLNYRPPPKPPPKSL